jgi:hypothetical protein
MNIMRRWPCLCLVSLGLVCSSLVGCQTNVAGMTLPSGYYMQHPPQYIPPSPPFPLTRELAEMEAQNGGATPPAVAAPVPPSPVAPAIGTPPVPPEHLTR